MRRLKFVLLLSELNFTIPLYPLMTVYNAKFMLGQLNNYFWLSELVTFRTFDGSGLESFSTLFKCTKLSRNNAFLNESYVLIVEFIGLAVLIIPLILDNGKMHSGSRNYI